MIQLVRCKMVSYLLWHRAWSSPSPSWQTTLWGHQSSSSWCPEWEGGPGQANLQNKQIKSADHSYSFAHLISFLQLCTSYIIPTALHNLYHSYSFAHLISFLQPCTTCIIHVALHILYHSYSLAQLISFLQLCTSYIIPTALHNLYHSCSLAHLISFLQPCTTYIIPTALHILYHSYSLAQLVSFLQTCTTYIPCSKKQQIVCAIKKFYHKLG